MSASVHLEISSVFRSFWHSLLVRFEFFVNRRRVDWKKVAQFLTARENSWDDSFGVSESFQSQKKAKMDYRDCSAKFLTETLKMFCRGTFLWFWKFLVSKEVVHKRAFPTSPLLVPIYFVEGIFRCLLVLACGWYRLNL